MAQHTKEKKRAADWTNDELWDTNPHYLPISRKVATSMVEYKYSLRRLPDFTPYDKERYCSLLRNHMVDAEYQTHLAWYLVGVIITIISVTASLLVTYFV